jgi:hypothetical protein
MKQDEMGEASRTRGKQIRNSYRDLVERYEEKTI